MKDGSIDLIVTSPPYWGLRDYGDETNTTWPDGWKGQLGLEPHPQQYLEHLWQIFEEGRRVLGRHGSLYINLGDTYCGSWGSIGKTKSTGQCDASTVKSQPKDRSPQAKVKFDKGWLQPKQLMLIPSRFAIGMQERGWILRNDIIWHKPNAMPSSVKDRLNTTYEHVFHFVKSRRYHYDLDAIREPWRDERPADIQRALDKHPGYEGKYGRGYNAGNQKNRPGQGIKGQPVGDPTKGKNPGDHWSITTRAFPEAHFAVYPEALIERIIKSSCPKEGTVLDPFMGSGTTIIVARKLLRKGIGFDIALKYTEMARARARKIPERLERFLE